LGRDGVFAVTAAIEGHPDNVAPATYGGFTVSALGKGGHYVTRSLPLPGGWRLLFGVPSFELFTEAARRLLPSSYARSDVVRTSSRSALWAVAVATDEPELLRTACLDVLHQPYRAGSMAGFNRCLEQALAAGAYAAFLSGAGPTVAAVANSSTVSDVSEALQRYAGPQGRVLELATADGYQAGPLRVNEAHEAL
jgi:homoserine kinase